MLGSSLALLLSLTSSKIRQYMTRSSSNLHRLCVCILGGGGGEEGHKSEMLWSNPLTLKKFMENGKYKATILNYSRTEIFDCANTYLCFLFVQVTHRYISL